MSIILGAIFGACAAVGSAISSACSAIGGALFTKVAGGIATVAKTLIPNLPTLNEIIEVAKTVFKVIACVADVLGILEEGETPEEIAIAAEEADLKPEDFDSIEEYIQYIRQEMKTMDMDEKLENLSDEDRLKYQAIGSAITIKGIEEKYNNIQMPADFWFSVAKLKMSPDNIKTYMDVFKENGIKSMGEMSSYIKNEGQVSDVDKVSGSIMESLGKIYPDLSEEELYKKLEEMENSLLQE